MNLETFITLPRCWQWGGTRVIRTVDGENRTLAGEDCTTLAASWVLDQTGVDPAAEVRGAYDALEGARALVTAHGGIERLGAVMLEPHGLFRVSDLRDGDIGVVLAPTGLEEGVIGKISAIRFGSLWAVMSARGVMVKRLDWTGVAWRI